MKIRNGFVSNSSSSNFILAFPHKPVSAEDVHEMMFGENTMLLHPYPQDSWEAEYSSVVVAETVWNDIKDKEPVGSEAEIIEEIGSGWFDGYPRHQYGEESSFKYAREFEQSHGGKSIFQCQESNPVEYQVFREMRDAEREAEHREIAEAAKRFWEEHRLPDDHVKYVVNYSDNDGSFGCFMEHGGVFDGLPHIQISHH